MKELPIDAAIEDFLDAVYEETGSGVVCPFCHNAEWEHSVDTPMGVTAVKIRPPVSDDDSTWTGYVAVGLSCTKCGFIRLHKVDLAE